MIKPNTSNGGGLRWVQETAASCQPDQVCWCDGSESEKELLLREALGRGIVLRLNEKKLPGCYYHRSTADVVARLQPLAAKGWILGQLPGITRQALDRLVVGVQFPRNENELLKVRGAMLAK